MDSLQFPTLHPSLPGATTACAELRKFLGNDLTPVKECRGSTPHAALLYVLVVDFMPGKMTVVTVPYVRPFSAPTFQSMRLVAQQA